MPLLENVTMKEFEGLRNDIQTVLLPVGSVEEHGAHLPLGTDTFHALEIARRVALERKVWVAPPLWYGLCRSTSDHPGTVGIRGITLRSVICDLVESLYNQGMKNIIILSGHAGGTHMAMIVDACEEMIKRLPELKCAVLSVLDLRKHWDGIVETPDDSHAGEVETSIIAYLMPEALRGSSSEEYPSFPDYLIVRDKRRFWRGGVWGDPAKASPEKGKAIMERSVREICRLVDRMNRD
ncbi:creatininase family protein [Thermodesulforhabdus norvegica]|uniref:Creatinine amidohydrolase n=1 Tax=Thermodesulforhabdus norvegica TaxID=39841 RepID=A0A1I4TR37_9BACT|nr:creatininase family protein [Thermodesulforhabdus norvegica]SFM79080.1 creatinine amidohydrolase [Thermodesulforhabdus norvegica]